jgi:hypothetical protein
LGQHWKRCARCDRYQAVRKKGSADKAVGEGGAERACSADEAVGDGG